MLVYNEVSSIPFQTLPVCAVTQQDLVVKFSGQSKWHETFTSRDVAENKEAAMRL